MILPITVEQAREKSRSWQINGDNWHFHVLSPACLFNTDRTKYALILENQTTGQICAVYSETGFSTLSQDMLKLLYGEKILARPDAPPNLPDKRIEQILNRCEESSRENIPWHHHMLFPDCVFNDEPGKWNLVLEIGREPQVINISFDQQPLAALKRIEIAYFQNIDRVS